MRQAKSAIVRKRHPIPTGNEVLHDLNGSTVFSKLDIKWAFHQVELSEGSRPITTFATHKRLFRYKKVNVSDQLCTWNVSESNSASLRRL